MAPLPPNNLRGEDWYWLMAFLPFTFYPNQNDTEVEISSGVTDATWPSCNFYMILTLYYLFMWHFVYIIGFFRNLLKPIVKNG